MAVAESSRQPPELPPLSVTAQSAPCVLLGGSGRTLESQVPRCQAFLGLAAQACDGNVSDRLLPVS